MVIINLSAITLNEYSIGVLDLTEKQIKDMDTKTEKTLTQYKSLHPRAYIQSLHVKRREGGWGLRQIDAVTKKTLINIKYFLDANSDKLIAKAIVNLDLNNCTVTDTSKMCSLPVNINCPVFFLFFAFKNNFKAIMEG